MDNKSRTYYILTMVLLLAATACSNSDSGNMSASKTSYMLKLDKFYTEIGFEEGNTDTIRVEAPNTSWEVIDTVDWITVTPSSGKGSKDIVIKVKENPSLEEYRSAVLEIHSTEKDFQSVHNYQVIQKNAEPYIIPDNTEINCGAEGTTVPITIKSNVEWDYEAHSWIEVNRLENTLTITVKENISEQRSGRIVLGYFVYGKATYLKPINYIYFTQEKGKPHAVPEKSEIICDADGTTEQISVESNCDWTPYCTASWLTATKDNDKLKIVIDDNISSDREATIQLQYQQSTVSVIRVIQKTANKEFSVTGNGKTVTFMMCRVKAGGFQMGLSADGNDVTPVHSVTLTKDYYLGETEVTQGLWYAVMGQKPTSNGSAWSSSFGVGDNYPAYYISYEDCEQFLTKLNQMTGQNFRFPTEAEWEFAAKGGNKSKGYTYAGSNLIRNVARYTDNSGSSTHAVKTRAANELGLYDMSGNVQEWCYDWYGSYSSSAQTDPTGSTSGFSRANRGGSWYSSASSCRCASRFFDSPSVRFSSLGFRLAL